MKLQQIMAERHQKYVIIVFGARQESEAEQLVQNIPKKVKGAWQRFLKKSNRDHQTGLAGGNTGPIPIKSPQPVLKLECPFVR
jgi:hypothetical protein